ncbi:hypothetical protein K439DRAFT_432508 [Ramaria rubella]|nr:hypothetical protein K439DRAFT_432508 [Ramaria rubella]
MRFITVAFVFAAAHVALAAPLYTLVRRTQGVSGNTVIPYGNDVVQRDYNDQGDLRTREPANLFEREVSLHARDDLVTRELSNLFEREVSLHARNDDLMTRELSNLFEREVSLHARNDDLMTRELSNLFEREVSLHARNDDLMTRELSNLFEREVSLHARNDDLMTRELSNLFEREVSLHARNDDLMTRELSNLFEREVSLHARSDLLTRFNEGFKDTGESNANPQRVHVKVDPHSGKHPNNSHGSHGRFKRNAPAGAALKTRGGESNLDGGYNRVRRASEGFNDKPKSGDGKGKGKETAEDSDGTTNLGGFNVKFASKKGLGKRRSF